MNAERSKLAVKELGRRSVPGTAASLVGLILVEVAMFHLPGFPALKALALFVAVLLLRVVMYLVISRDCGSLRRQWALAITVSICTHGAWGVMIAAVQIDVEVSTESVVMAFLMCGVATGGVSAFAPSRPLQWTTLVALVLPVTLVGLICSGSATFAVMHMMFFGFMLALGNVASRDFWRAIEREALLRGHAESARVAALAAESYAGQLRQESEQRAAVELELRHAQKLEAIGRLAAGIAHEINTPVQFVSNSCEFAHEGLDSLCAALCSYRAIISRLAESDIDPLRARELIAEVDNKHEIEYLSSKLPESMQCAADGLERISKIVAATKEFAYRDRADKALADINKAIRSTLVVAHHETKYVATVETEFADIPMIPCHCGEFNQVILNLIVNAAHAIAEISKVTGLQGRIRLKTWATTEAVCISISDTGVGIAPDIADKIFEPFFTTKPVGVGSGQGLAIARSVIVDKHGGTIRVSSKVGSGSTFTITLPIGASST